MFCALKTYWYWHRFKSIILALENFFTQLYLYDALFLHILDIAFFSKPKFYYNLKAMIVTYSVCFNAVLSCSESVIGCVSVVYHALYLEELTAHELTRKISNVLSLPLTLINQVYRQGPTGIHILLSNQVRTRMHIIKVAITLFSVPLLLSENRSVMFDFSFCIFICILQTCVHVCKLQQQSFIQHVCSTCTRWSKWC